MDMKLNQNINWDEYIRLSPEQLEIARKTIAYWNEGYFPLKKWTDGEIKKHVYILLDPHTLERYENYKKEHDFLAKKLGLPNLNSLLVRKSKGEELKPSKTNEIESPDISKQMVNIVIDRQTVGGYRAVNAIYLDKGFKQAIERMKRTIPRIFKDVVQFIDPETGETVKGPMYDTTTQKIRGYQIQDKLSSGIKQQPPLEDTQYEPRARDRMENPNMNEATKFRNVIKECISEIKRERNPRIRLKESLRNVVKTVLKEMATTTGLPKPDETEKIKIQKGYAKDGNERLDKDNEKLQSELEAIVHGIDPKWESYWDDHGQLIVRAQNLLYVRICPQFENNYNVDAMVRLVDRVRAIALTWEQVKSFVKANFSALKPETKADSLKQKAMDHIKDREVIKKDAGPESQKVKVRYQDPSNPSVKDTKKDDRNYNEPQTKRDEDMPDQPMKQVTEPGKDPESKNKDIKKTDKVKSPKHKNDKKLRIPDKKTSKFTLKQVKS